MNFFLSALRRTAHGCFFSNSSILKGTTLTLLTAASLSTAAHAADLPDAIFFDPPEGMAQDSEGRFFAKLSALAMHRAENPNVLLVSSDFGTPTAASEIRGHDLSNGWAAGAELIVGLNDVWENGDAGNWNIWARGQLIGNWSSSAHADITPESPTIPGSVTLGYLNNIPTFAHRMSTITADYSSDIWSVDLNLEKQVSRKTKLLAGLRYINIKEELRLRDGLGDGCIRNFLGFCTPIANADELLDIVNRADNKMYGAQIGVDQKLIENENGFAIGVQGILGVAINDMKTSARGGFRSSAFSLTTINAEAQSRELSLFAEGNLSASYEVTDNILLDLGYRALWLQETAGVVRAIPNLDPTPGSMAAEASRVQTDDMLLHGGRLGLKVRF